MKNINIVAEIGCNHMGQINLAKKFLITLKDFCNIKYAKFQKRHIPSLFTKDEYEKPHPVPGNSFGSSYGKHREKLEFSINQHKKLKKFSQQIGIRYCCSAWDLKSAEEISKLKPEYIKIPSGSNLNFKIYEYLANNYHGEIHISLGMTSKNEEIEIVKFLKKKKILHKIVLYACTSGYPVPFNETYLLEISRLKCTYGKNIKAVGFSGHHNGIAIDMAAIALGAEWIERHFTLDRTWKGTDHAASLEPDGMRKLVRNSNEIVKGLTFKKGMISKIEIDQRNKLKKIVGIK